jgi:hypothetical protein
VACSRSDSPICNLEDNILGRSIGDVRPENILLFCRHNFSVAEHCIDILSTRYQANISAQEDFQAEEASSSSHSRDYVPLQLHLSWD